MLAYKKVTCLATECSIDADVAVVLRAHKEGQSPERSYSGQVGVAPIEEKLTQHRLRWFGHIQRRPPEALVRNGVLEQVDNVKKGRGRPKLTQDESVKRDLKDWNIFKEIALDRSAWRLAINVPEP